MFENVIDSKKPGLVKFVCCHLDNQFNHQYLKLEVQIKSLPNTPGVYQYYDRADKILYIGKAKNLKRRVSSYFNKNHENGKTRVLVEKIASIKHIVVETETDALLLENNLIKKYQPKYNVLLKDDKTYPWICIKKEAFPNVSSQKNSWKGFFFDANPRVCFIIF